MDTSNINFNKRLSIISNSSQDNSQYAPISSRRSINNGWSTSIERLIKKWGEESLSLQWMHLEEAKNKLTWNNLLAYTSVILSGFAGAAGFLYPECDSIWDKTYKIAAATSAAIMLLHKTRRDLEFVEKHKSSAYKFQSFGNDIQYQLTLKRSKRKPGIQYLSEMKDLFILLQNEAPNIEQRIINKYKSKFKTIEVAQPDIADGLSPIEIKKNTESDSSKSKSDNQSIVDLNNMVTASSSPNEEYYSTSQPSTTQPKNESLQTTPRPANKYRSHSPNIPIEINNLRLSKSSAEMKLGAGVNDKTLSSLEKEFNNEFNPIIEKIKN